MKKGFSKAGANHQPEPLGGNTASAPGDSLVSAFTEFRDELVSTLLYLLGNREDAQEMAQEAFLRCWKKKDDIGQIINIKAWVFRIALNASKDLKRSAWKRKSRAFPEEEIMKEYRTASPLDQVEDKESLDLIRKAMMDLRPEEKEVFLLRENGEMTYEQIAEHSHRPVGTVKTQMRSALQKLREALIPAGQS